MNFAICDQQVVIDLLFISRIIFNTIIFINIILCQISNNIKKIEFQDDEKDWLYYKHLKEIFL